MPPANEDYEDNEDNEDNDTNDDDYEDYDDYENYEEDHDERSTREKVVTEYNAQDISNIARDRTISLSRQTHLKSMKDSNRDRREKVKGAPLRAKLPNGVLTSDMKKANNCRRVAIHRARREGKTEEQALAAGNSAHIRSMLRSARKNKKDKEAEALQDDLNNSDKKRAPRKKTPQAARARCLAIKTGQNGIPAEDKELCQMIAGWGTDHTGFGRCRYHGGAAPNGRIAAERERLMTEMVKREVSFYGDPVNIDPVEALAQEVRRTAGHVNWLADQVREMEQSELTEYYEHSGRQANTIIKMYQAERDRLVLVSKTAIQAGVAERRVALAEHQGAMMAAVIQAILFDRELNLTPEQKHLARGVVRKHLTAIETTGEDTTPTTQTTQTTTNQEQRA